MAAPAQEPVPDTIEPMRAVTGEVPTDDSPWAYEIKWDGMRAIATCDRGALGLRSANGLDATARFPELGPLADSLSAHRVVLDGEIVAFGPDGRPSFGLLQPRIQASSAATIAERAAAQPVVYVIFDLLWLDGHDVTALAYADRTRLLRDLVEPGPTWQVVEPQLGSGADLLAAVAERGLEGLIAKRRDSRYEPGRRSGAWRKLKVRRRQELVVGGWLPGQGARATTLGSLLVGYYEGDALRYAGRVGTGFTDADLRSWLAELAARGRATTPFDPPPPRAVARRARWVEPELVAEVAFGEWTGDGILRHPALVGRRVDKDPRRVVREPAG